MDTVILAAGRGTRLEGVAAPYLKPLLVVSGRSLITQAVDAARAATEGRIIVVVAPENASPISAVLGDREVTMIVQRFPRGPGAALLEGLTVADSELVLVLMADNLTSPSCVRECATTRQPTVGTQVIPLENAKRFTYLDGYGTWVEDGSPKEEDTTVWCGPLVLNRKRARATLRSNRPDVGELKIGAHLSQMLDGDEWHVTATDTIDIGVPEMLT